MSEARKHHYVPQFLLKRFANDEDLLTVVERRYGTVSEKSPAAVFYEVDYYRVEEREVPPTAYEEEFARLESEAAQLVPRIDAAGAIPEQTSPDYVLLMAFIALQAMRGPHARRRLAEGSRMLGGALEHMKRVRAAMGTRMKNPEDVDSLEEYLADADTTARHVSALLFGAEAVFSVIGARAWSILRPAHGRSFVVSDHPVALTWSDPSRDWGMFGAGFGLGGTDVTMPIGSDALLLGRFESETLWPSGTVLSPEMTASANSRSLSHAVRFAAARSAEITWSMRGSVLGLAELRDEWKAHPVSAEEDLRVPERGATPGCDA